MAHSGTITQTLPFLQQRVNHPWIEPVFSLFAVTNQTVIDAATYIPRPTTYNQASITHGGFYKDSTLETEWTESRQFTGTLSPAAEKPVMLRRKGGNPLEIVQANASGYFEFTRWYYPYTDYEFVIHDSDGYECVYPVTQPTEHEYRGDETRYGTLVT